MDKKKLEYNQKILQERFYGFLTLNKKQMLQAINKSNKSWERAEKANNKYDFPEPSEQKSYNRATAKYNTYKYDLYDIAIFITDKNYYWEMIEKRKKDVKNG